MGDSVLIHDLNLKIGPGDHLMITGANGTGKTSVMRVLAGLWPHFSGIITRPDLKNIFYVPQRPYLAIGTLREQVIYPHSVKQMKELGRTDEELMSILKTVYLDYIPAREGGWNAIKEWKDVFSGGNLLNNVRGKAKNPAGSGVLSYA
jgi:ATP-binding cassette, subfamily D (ALD), peroxisomal long-chain fatty acid import protein